MSKRWLFIPLPAGKPWNGATPHTEPLGGSEASVAFTAQALARAGEDVTVVSHGTVTPGAYYKVHYFPTNNLGDLLDQTWDVVVVSRWVEATTPPKPWKTRVLFFWSHDMPQGRVHVTAHKAVFLSEYHKAAWGIPDSIIIGDGVELDMFDNIGDVERNPMKVLWVSNPDRGLPLAANIFQKVRKRWPDLELHVFGRSSVYGWDAATESPFLPRRGDMQNVFMHEALPRYSLAAELKTAWCVFYPTWWPETYCMATLEAQAAGTPVICSPNGALPETVKGGILTYDYLNAFSQLRNVRRWHKMSEAGYEWAKLNTWDIRAAEWNKAAEDIINA